MGGGDAPRGLAEGAAVGLVEGDLGEGRRAGAYAASARLSESKSSTGKQSMIFVNLCHFLSFQVVKDLLNKHELEKYKGSNNIHMHH